MAVSRAAIWVARSKLSHSTIQYPASTPPDSAGSLPNHSMNAPIAVNSAGDQTAWPVPGFSDSASSYCDP